MYWKWNVHCEKCGYKSRFFNQQWMARVLAFYHVITRHPFAYQVISAVDEITYAKNRQG